MNAKERFSTAVASVLPMSAVSALIYLSNGSLALPDNGVGGFVAAARFFVPGAVGGAFGAFVMDRISPRLLKLIFAALMVFAGVRIIAR